MANIIFDLVIGKSSTYISIFVCSQPASFQRYGEDGTQYVELSLMRDRPSLIRQQSVSFHNKPNPNSTVFQATIYSSIDHTIKVHFPQR